MQINWSESMEQSFEYYEVDPNTWKDMRIINTIKSSSLSRDSGAQTLGSASIEANEVFGECYIRIYLIIIQNKIKHKINLGIYLIQTPTLSFDGKIKSATMDAYTPLIELKEKLTPIGFTIPKETNILNSAYILVRDNCRAPVVKTVSDKTLEENFVTGGDETYLDFISDLLKKAKYELYLDEDGNILFSPEQTLDELQPIWTYNDDNSSILYPEISLKNDIYGIPNVVEVSYKNDNYSLYSRIVNDDPDSVTSIQARGREIVHRDSSPDLPGLPTQEQLDMYATNLLKKLNSVEYEISYSHGYCPVRVGDCVRLNYNVSGLTGIKAKVTRQTIKCDTGCTVQETAIFTKKLWK